MTDAVMELARFHLRPDADETAFLAASAALQEDFLAVQPGFEGRDLVHFGGTEWMDVVLWRTGAEAEAAMAAAESHPAAGAHFAFLDMSRPPEMAHPAVRQSWR